MTDDPKPLRHRLTLRAARPAPEDLDAVVAKLEDDARQGEPSFGFDTVMLPTGGEREPIEPMPAMSLTQVSALLRAAVTATFNAQQLLVDLEAQLTGPVGIELEEPAIGEAAGTLVELSWSAMQLADRLDKIEATAQRLRGLI